MFVKITKGQAAPITLTEFRKMYWETSFPQDIPLVELAEKGVYPARNIPQPKITKFQRASMSDAFTQVDGEWVRGWDIRDMSKIEIQKRLSCTKMQAIVTLGKTELARLEDFLGSLDYSWIALQLLENTPVWHRFCEDVLVVQYGLGYTEDEMDAFFTKAMALEV